jgi:hypothetical protein
LPSPGRNDFLLSLFARQTKDRERKKKKNKKEKRKKKRGEGNISIRRSGGWGFSERRWG